MRRHQFLGTTAIALAVLACSGGATVALAQDASDTASQATNLGDVIVTARKREERLLDVPISVQSFSEEEIRNSGIADLQSLKDRAAFQAPPALSTSAAGRLAGIIVFRGLQASAFGTDPRDSSGSLFVDGIYISGGQNSINTADVERIEVLKGPQNTYFGRSTFGGAVNFITRNPSDEFGGEFNGSATARGTVDADISVEGALIPGLLSARLTALTHNKVAQHEATDGGDMGAEETQSLTGTLYFTPSENLWVRLRGHVQQDEDSAANIALIPSTVYGSTCTGTYPGYNQRTGTGPITLGRNYFCDGIPTIDDTGEGIITANTALPPGLLSYIQANPANIPFFNDAPDLEHSGFARDALRLSLQSGYDFGNGGSLSLNVGYNEQDSIAIWDVDRTDAQGFFAAQAFHSDDFTADIRYLSDPEQRLRYLIGASYFESKYQISQIDYSYFTSTASRSFTFQDARAEVQAVYGSIDFDLLDNLTLTAEGRYQEDTPTYYNAAGAKFEKSYTDFLPRISVKYSPIEDLNIYASFAEGVQPAGFNAGFISLNPAQQAYVQSIYPGISEFSLVPELDAYEVGVKQRLMDGALSYTLSVYQMDWDNAVTTSALFNPAACYAVNPPIALTAACPLAANGTSVTTPNNARIRGVEFALNGQISDQWSVGFTADYKDAEWVTYANSGLNTLAGLTTPGDVYRGDGNSLARVPDLSATLSSTYTGALSDGWSYYLRGDVLYTGEAWDSDLNVVQTDDYARVNARLGFQKDELTLELFANNLFDDENWDYASATVELSGNFTQRALLVAPAQRREIGVRLQAKF